MEHTCYEVVNVQQSAKYSDFSLPEPWSGEIDKAKLLFVSSNPSIGEIPPKSPCEIYPNGSWEDHDIINYFNGRFGGRGKNYISGGIKTLLDNGQYGKSVAFWSSVKARAREIYDRDVIPGMDYALTEVVHCKSKDEIGVSKARKYCSEQYMKDILENSRANIVVVLGVQARLAMADLLPAYFNGSSKVTGPIEFFGRNRLILSLQHPNARGFKRLQRVLTNDELLSIRKFVEQ